MRIILQRVTGASVSVEGGAARVIGRGLVALVGFGPGDDERTVEYMAAKTTELRIFEDAGGQMNLSLMDIGGELLAVPNFTLYASCKKGRRPSFTGSMPPAEATLLFDYYTGLMLDKIPNAQAGVFGTHMDVSIMNDGPVTIILDSAEIMPGQR
jgi:D-tyrosyl-tRNA(Tyr) deacylase